MSNPYSPPTAVDSHAGSVAIARRRVARPATALIVMSSIHSVMWSIALVSSGVMAARGVLVGGEPLGLAAGIVQLVALLTICIGAAQMGHLKSLRMARIAAVLACIPGLTPFFILGIPFGIWSLVLLHDATIRREFPSKLASEGGG